MTVASPEATGQAGAFFEQHVDAAFLALLLVRGVPPFMLRAELTEVHLQAGHLGWATDDIVLVGIDGDGHRRRAAISVKRTFTAAKGDSECVDVFTKAWRDFNSQQFDRAHDVIGLVTRPASEKVLRASRVLLDTARASIDGADFMARLALPGYRDKTARTYAATIREVIGTAHGQTPSDDELRAFLCCFDFVPLDLNSPSSVTEALLVSLLRANAAPGQASTVANETWQELLALVSATSQDAKSFGWDALPAAMRSHYSVSNTYMAGLLEPFDQMTRVVRDSAATVIAGHHEPRADLTQHALELLETTRVVLISGMAGSGKSAIAKSVFDASGPGRFAMAMRAETLARPSIGESFVSMGTSLRRLQEVTALNASKVLWIDGAERLLEKLEREAFNDLMQIVKGDTSWHVIITCRSYSLETFKAAFLDHHGIESEILLVSALRAEELDAFKTACPVLERPLSSEPLRNLLSNPFFLKMAARMKWTADVALPRTEREFRLAVWRQAIRRDDDIVDGMPLRRERTYVQVARKRAESLEAFVDVDGLDAGAITKLQADTLLFESDEALGHFAPAHDVLEDWALLQWLDREYERARRGWPAFLAALGTCPAIRRALRVWLTERLETDSNALAKVAELVADTTIERHWTDDAVVAVLRCSDPAPFLRTNEEALLGSGAQLLQRAVHLTRVACQQSLAIETEHGVVGVQRPTGAAWQRLAEFIGSHLEDVVPQCPALLLRFLEDWCTQVSNDAPYPAGSEAVAAIARRLLADVDVHEYSPAPSTKRLLTVLLRVPRESAETIRQLTRECLAEKRFHEEEPFIDLVLSHFHGAAVCRDLPDVTFAIVERMLKTPSPRDENRYTYERRETITEAFGLDDGLDHHGHPASAFHGPFLNLLNAHPRDGLRFIIKTLNRCSAAYLSARGDDIEFEFTLPSGKRVRHRGDGGLWAMYRVNFGPHVLRSMLMALEHWLLELGRLDNELLRNVTTEIMEAAETIAITAVVVSVVMASPEALGELAVEFFRHHDILRLDRSRWSSDQTNSDKMLAEAFPPFSAENAIYSNERIRSAELPHRRIHLEMLAVLLQQGTLRARVQSVLDEVLAALPGEDERADEDRLWCLALHRMDIRKIEVGKDLEGNAYLRLTPPPADVQALLDREQPGQSAIEEGLGVYNWANARYSRRDESSYPASQWQSRLEHARTKPPVAYADARLLVAVVCLRDQLPELGPDDREWCIGTICAAFEEGAAGANDFGLGIGSGTREAASELAGILVRVDDSTERRRLEQVLTRTLAVQEHEISRHASMGIGRELSGREPALLKSLATALDEYTRNEYSSAASFRRMSLSDRRQDRAARVRQKHKSEMARTVACRRIDLQSILTNDYFKSPSRFIVRELADMFCPCSADLDAKAFFSKLGQQLRETWAADQRGRRRPDGEREGFDYQTEVVVADAICFFALGLAETEAVELFVPFRDVAQAHPEGVAKLLHHLTRKECDRHRPSVFWALWAVLADGLILWVNGVLRAQRSTMDDVADAIFLGLDWYQTTTTWRSMTGHDQLL